MSGALNIALHACKLFLNILGKPTSINSCVKSLCEIMVEVSYTHHFIYLGSMLYTRQKIITCSKLLKTGCNNVVLPTLFIVVNNIVQHCYTWEPSGPQVTEPIGVLNSVHESS